ncbi:hypothetical protein D3P04_11890 [Paracoccus onubensis]|uniref:Uncharacterized protein n=1 Tax=Paracoccus onubensis TaxID=1675788 RepID=A0A418SVK6_9RHOB|nr:hypothetical protein D3P04_11890 [Paracoccus onubensis]
MISMVFRGRQVKSGGSARHGHGPPDVFHDWPGSSDMVHGPLNNDMAARYCQMSRQVTGRIDIRDILDATGETRT